MFVSDEVLVPLSFPAAQARLVNLAHGGSLADASRGAYGEGIAGLIRVGPLGGGPGPSKLAEVRFLDVVIRDGSAVLTLRWEATGPGGVLFPALDADITLTPAGEQGCRLAVDGAYRPPLGAVGAGLDKAIMRRVATATMRSFLSRVAESVAQAPGEACVPVRRGGAPAVLLWLSCPSPGAWRGDNQASGKQRRRSSAVAR
jgi:hypothetical protein